MEYQRYTHATERWTNNGTLLFQVAIDEIVEQTTRKGMAETLTKLFQGNMNS